MEFMILFYINSTNIYLCPIILPGTKDIIVNILDNNSYDLRT